MGFCERGIIGSMAFLGSRDASRKWYGVLDLSLLANSDLVITITTLNGLRKGKELDRIVCPIAGIRKTQLPRCLAHYYVLQELQFQDLRSVRATSRRYNQLTLDHGLFASKLHNITLVLDNKFPEKNVYHVWRGQSTGGTHPQRCQKM
jgi:hypothetical protein